MSLNGLRAQTADFEGLPRGFVYLSIGFSAGAVIALQICIMRIFAVAMHIMALAKPKPRRARLTTIEPKWAQLGGWDDVTDRYVFDTRALTNDRPYFAAYVKTRDLPKVTDRLDLLQDEWGYLTVWATFGIAWVAAVASFMRSCR